MQQQDRIPHAVLIDGRAGLGKQAFANRLINSILCSQPDEGFTACGQCHSCQLRMADTHPDHTEISPEAPGKQIKVDQIRELKESQSLMPKVSAAKTVLITSADQMNISAYNSLLKLLEEPRSNTVLVLLTRNRDQLPVTIKSRCQTITIPVPTTDSALAWLQTQESSFTTEQWQTLLKLSYGAPLAAVELGEDGLQQQQQLMHDIALLMRAQANPVKMAAAWQSFDLKSVLLQVQSMMQIKISSLLQNDATISLALIKHYWAIVDCITETIKLISSQNNPNKVLLTEDFMVTVMHHANQIQQLQGMHR
jgi:DNA polymerase-3 subunit delta'